MPLKGQKFLSTKFKTGYGGNIENG